MVRARTSLLVACCATSIVLRARTVDLSALSSCSEPLSRSVSPWQRLGLLLELMGPCSTKTAELVLAPLINLDRADELYIRYFISST